MPFTVTTAPSILPVTVAQVKQQTNVDHSADDTLLEQYISAAVAHGQQLTGRYFVETGLQLDLDEFPAGNISLLPNLQSVGSITYVNDDDERVTLNADQYTVKASGIVGHVDPVDSWPEGTDVLVSLVAGWQVVSESVTTPADIQAWLLVKVADFYAQRESFVTSKAGVMGVAAMPATFIDNLLACYVVPGIGAGI